jgi:hypothetical protein
MQTAQGGAQDRNNAFSQGQQGGPQASGTGAPPDILGGYHAATLAMGQHMADVHEQVSGAQASLRQRATNYAARVPVLFSRRERATACRKASLRTAWEARWVGRL